MQNAINRQCAPCAQLSAPTAGTGTGTAARAALAITRRTFPAKPSRSLERRLRTSMRASSSSHSRMRAAGASAAPTTLALPLFALFVLRPLALLTLPDVDVDVEADALDAHPRRALLPFACTVDQKLALLRPLTGPLPPLAVSGRSRRAARGPPSDVVPLDPPAPLGLGGTAGAPRPYAPPPKSTGRSRGPALVCGRRALVMGLECATAGAQGDGGTSRGASARARRGDLDLERALGPAAASASRASVYFASASWRSAALVETIWSSWSASSRLSVPAGEVTMICAGQRGC